MHALLIDDRLNRRQVLKKVLKYQNIDTIICEDVANWLDKLKINDHHGVIIHHNPPIIDSLAINAIIKKVSPLLPVVILIDKKNPFLEKTAMCQGVRGVFDDTLPLSEVGQFLKVCLREKIKPASLVKQFKDLTVDLVSRTVRRQNKIVDLRNKEFLLLECLILNLGQVLSRNLLLESVWDRNANLLTNTVDVHINKLRQKIDHGFEEKLIQTIHCVGYKMG